MRKRGTSEAGERVKGCGVKGEGGGVWGRRGREEEVLSGWVELVKLGVLHVGVVGEMKVLGEGCREEEDLGREEGGVWGGKGIP